MGERIVLVNHKDKTLLFCVQAGTMKQGGHQILNRNISSALGAHLEPSPFPHMLTVSGKFFPSCSLISLHLLVPRATDSSRSESTELALSLEEEHSPGVGRIQATNCRRKKEKKSQNRRRCEEQGLSVTRVLIYLTL